MSEAFEDYLKAGNVNDDRLVVALRTYLLGQTDYLPEDSMRSEMVAKAADAAQVERLVEELKQDRESLVRIAHIVMGSVWHDPEQQERVKDAIQSTEEKLPVIEVALLTIAAMYGMYLIATGGMNEHTHTTIGPDGSVNTETTKYEPPTGPLKAIVNLFRP